MIAKLMFICLEEAQEVSAELNPIFWIQRWDYLLSNNMDGKDVTEEHWELIRLWGEINKEIDNG